MTEAELQSAVIDLAHLLKWRVAHFRPVRIQRADGSVYYETPVQADGKGWPDLVLVRECVLFVELKAEGKYLEPEQKEWQVALSDAAMWHHVWRPKDWTNGQIEKILR